MHNVLGLFAYLGQSANDCQRYRGKWKKGRGGTDKADQETDFLFMGWGYLRTGVFNIADMAIVFGVVLVLIMSHPKMAKKSP